MLNQEPMRTHPMYFTRPGTGQKITNTRRISETAEYKTWVAIKGRCHNPKSREYKHYGKRGIEVCPEWREDFWAFYHHMGPRPSPDHSIERKDNDKGYEPGNCEWATQPEQLRNKRTNRRVKAFGETRVLMDWVKDSPLGYATVSYRLNNGWAPEDALTTPPRGRKPTIRETSKPRGRVPTVMLTIGEETKPTIEWARELGISYPTLRYRLKVGWPIEEILTRKGRPKQ